MDHKYVKETVPFARELRKSMTREERILWYDFLRTYPVRFKRQHPIGIYIADFYCAEAKLVVEVDGSQHNTEEGLLHDEKRTEFFKQFGIRVLRFKNFHINESKLVVFREIDAAVKEVLGNAE